MKSVVAHYSKLESKIREKVEAFLRENSPEWIDFPYKGKLQRGFIFNLKDIRYLIINDTANEIVGYDEDDDSSSADMADIETDFDGEGEDEAEVDDDDEDDDKPGKDDGGEDDDGDDDEDDEDDDEDSEEDDDEDDD